MREKINFLYLRGLTQKNEKKKILYKQYISKKTKYVGRG